mmetsp:Transcript_20181/g.60257  ORF Transcript_20181/g.60257 Transcript_20181/m.60257 type:complete len:442 (-) Transcript_20181:444-1769(-)
MEGAGGGGAADATDDVVLPATPSPRPGSHGAPNLPAAATEVLSTFPSWGLAQRTEYLQMLVNSMTLADQASLARVLEPHLRRDFFCMLPEELCWNILSSLDDESLGRAAQVNRSWNMVLSNDFFWKRVINLRRAQSTTWSSLCATREYELSLSADSPQIPWRHKFVLLKKDIMKLKVNWKEGKPRQYTIPCNGNGIYCLQYDREKIVTGSRDNRIKIWDMQSRVGVQQLCGHDGSVLCLQFDDKKIISGSSDATVRVWDLATGKCLQTLHHHSQSVLHLRFLDDMLVTCSKDKTVMLWRADPRTGLYEPIHVLKEHRAAVNVVEFDEKCVKSLPSHSPTPWPFDAPRSGCDVPDSERQPCKQAFRPSYHAALSDLLISHRQVYCVSLWGPHHPNLGHPNGAADQTAQRAPSRNRLSAIPRQHYCDGFVRPYSAEVGHQQGD